MSDKLKLTNEEILRIENFQLKLEMARHLITDLEQDYKGFIDSLYTSRNITSKEYELDLQQQCFKEKNKT